MKIPQINNGKKPQELLNTFQLLPLPSSTPFGNLALKYAKIIERIDRVNVLIYELFSNFKPINTQVLDPNISLHKLIAEEIVYWLRKTADELISLEYLLFFQEKAGIFPTKIEIDCIGRLTNSPNDFQNRFNTHTNFLNTLNEIANAYKHSFINSEESYIETNEPYIFALALKYNNLNNTPQFYSVNFVSVIENFDKFFQDSVNRIKQCKLPHLNQST